MLLKFERKLDIMHYTFFLYLPQLFSTFPLHWPSHQEHPHNHTHTFPYCCQLFILVFWGNCLVRWITKCSTNNKSLKWDLLFYCWLFVIIQSTAYQPVNNGKRFGFWRHYRAKPNWKLVEIRGRFFKARTKSVTYSWHWKQENSMNLSRGQFGFLEAKKFVLSKSRTFHELWIIKI